MLANRVLYCNVIIQHPMSLSFCANENEMLNNYFSFIAVFPSIRLGLINAEDLTLSGDGISVASHASPYGKHLASCPYASECSHSNYGRTVCIKNDSGLRFQTAVPRDSELYRSIYSERTACERVNNLVLNDYLLQNLKICGKDHLLS